MKTIACPPIPAVCVFKKQDFTLEYGLHSPFARESCHKKHSQLFIMPDAACEAECFWQAPEAVRQHRWFAGPRILYVPPQLPYALDWKREAALVRFSFTARFLQQAGVSLPHGNLIIRHEWEVAGADLMVHLLFGIFGKLCRQLQPPPEAHWRYLEALGAFAARHILAGFHPREKSAATAGLPFPHLRRVEEYVAANLQDQIKIRQLAEIAGFGQHHFTRLFKTSLGMVPSRYILMKRLEYAQRLFAQGKYTMAEIAAEAGFFDQSHLGQALKRFCREENVRKNNADFIPAQADFLQVTGK